MARFLAAIAILSVGLLGVPARAWPQAGWYATPSFRLTESFDDNIFGTSSNRQSDFVSTFSPGIEGGYRSEPFTLLLNGGFDAQVFVKNPDQNDATSGWHTGLNASYLPTRLLTLGLNFAYTETRSLTTLTQDLVALNLANPLNPANTLEFGRQKTTLLALSPTVSYQFTPTTSGNSSYSYTHSTFEGEVPNTAHNFQLGASHQFTPLDTGTATYRFSFFESPGTDNQFSNAFLIGWTRQLSPQTDVSVELGPRFDNDGSVRPAVNARLGHTFKALDQVARLALAYSYSQGFVVGQAGPVNTQAVTGSLAFEPLRSLLVSANAGVSWYSGGTSEDTTTYGVGLSATYQILRWLGARGSYFFSYQDQDTGNIPHNIVSLGLDVSYPFRIDR